MSSTQPYIYRGSGEKPKNKETLRDWIEASNNYRMIIFLLGALFVLAGSFVIASDDKLGIIVVAGVIGIAMVLSILARPYLGMYILTVFTYTNLSTVLNEAFGVPSVNKILVVLILVAVMGTRIVLQRKPLLFRSTEGAIMLYVVVATISAVISTGLDEKTMENVLDFVKDFILIFIIVQLSTEENAWKYSQWILIGSAVGLSLLTWFQFTTDSYAMDFFGLATSRTDSVQGDTSAYIDFHRVGGPVGDPNFYAQMLVMIMPLAVYRFLTDPSRLARMLGLLAAVIIGGAIIFTYSRATLMVMIAVIGMILVERKIAVWKIGIGASFLLVLIFPLLPTSFKARMLTIVGISATSEEQEDVSAQGRLSEMLVAIEMFKDYPVYGIGYAQYEDNYQSYSAFIGLDQRIEKRQAHNLYLEIAGEMGIIGLAAFTVMVLLIFRASYEARKTLSKLGRYDLIPWLAAVNFGMASYMLNSIFLHDDYFRFFWLCIAFVVGATATVETLKEEAANRQNRPALSISSYQHEH